MERRYKVIISVLGIIVAALLGVIAGSRIAQHADPDWPVIIKSASDLMTGVGIAIAGAWTWYLVKRRGFLEPRAALVHRYAIWELNGARHLRLYVEIQNPSEVAIRPGDGSTRVQRPPPDKINPKLYAENVWNDIVILRHSLGFEDVTIEPKESETFSHDIELPDTVRYVQVTTEMICRRTKEMERIPGSKRPTDDLDIGDEIDRWTLTTLIDLKMPFSKHNAAGQNDTYVLPTSTK